MHTHLISLHPALPPRASPTTHSYVQDWADMTPACLSSPSPTHTHSMELSTHRTQPSAACLHAAFPDTSAVPAAFSSLQPLFPLPLLPSFQHLYASLSESQLKDCMYKGRREPAHSATERTGGVTASHATAAGHSLPRQVLGVIHPFVH